MAADNPDTDAFDRKFLFSEIDHDGVKIVILCDQSDFMCGGALEALNSDFVIDSGHDDFIFPGRGCAVHGEKVTVVDAYIDHAVAGYP